MKKLLLLLTSVFILQGANSQITRGALEDEIYISGQWFLEPPYTLYDAIIRSDDNGQNISIQYYNTEIPPPPQGEMEIDRLTGDTEPGILYNYTTTELWISYDYGISWEFIESEISNNYESGRVSGELYKRKMGLFRSTDFGQNFTLLFDTLNVFKFEIGHNEGEFYGFEPLCFDENDFTLLHTVDFGQTFDSTLLDTIITGYSQGAPWQPKLSRGANEGELYLYSWHPSGLDFPAYHLYYSNDYGQNFELRYVSEPIDRAMWSVQITAGRTQGVFYVLRACIDPITNDHSLIYIDYSVDTAKTFHTYFHDLDSTVSINEPPTSDKSDQLLQCYPNPFTTSTKISFELQENSFIKASIFNINGQLLKRLLNKNLPAGKHQMNWDGKNDSGNLLKNGMYFIRIKTSESVMQKKIVLLR